MVELKRQILHASFVPAARNRGTVVPIPEALFDLAYHGGSDPKDVRNWLLPWIGCKRDEMWNDPYSFFCFIPFDLRVRDVLPDLQRGLDPLPRLEDSGKLLSSVGPVLTKVREGSDTEAGLYDRLPQLEARLVASWLTVKSSDGRVLRTDLHNSQGPCIHGKLLAAIINAHERDMFTKSVTPACIEEALSGLPADYLMSGLRMAQIVNQS